MKIRLDLRVAAGECARRSVVEHDIKRYLKMKACHLENVITYRELAQTDREKRQFERKRHLKALFVRRQQINV